MISVEKPGSPEELVHFGVKGQKWGVRKQRTESGRQPVSKKRKAAYILGGVGVTVGTGALIPAAAPVTIAAGAAFAVIMIRRAGNARMSELHAKRS